MPELPDVEIIKKLIDKNMVGKRILDLIVIDARVIKGFDENTLSKEISDKVVKSIIRHGKYLFISIDNNIWLTMHFGMTGGIVIVNKNDEETRFERLSFFLENNKRIAFVDQRLLGRVGLTSSPDSFISQHKIGPDALSLTWKEFYTVFRPLKTSIKSALMDQSKISGIGNVYADEILFQSKIDPLHLVAKLADDDIERIFKQTGLVLKAAIKFNADRDKFPESFIIKHRKKNSACPRCKGNIAVKKIDERSAYYCPSCQK